MRDDQLTDAIATRDVIGQAKGILMHRNRITGQQAFTLLVHTSQHTQIKLVDIVRWTVEEHESTLPKTSRFSAVTSHEFCASSSGRPVQPVDEPP